MIDQPVAAAQAGWTDSLFDIASADAQQGNFVSTVFVGVYIGAVCLAIHTATFVWALSALTRSKDPRTKAGLRALTSLLWACALLNEACNAVFDARAWAYDDGTPDAVLHYFMLHQPARLNAAAIAGALLSTLATDTFLLVRCYQWWRNPWAFVPLAMYFLVALVWDILAGAYSAGRASALYSIWVMPIYADWPLAAGLAGALHSALPYALASLVFLALYCARDMAAKALLVQLQGVTVDLIVVRVARGSPPLPLPLPAPVLAQGTAGPVSPACASVVKSESMSKGTGAGEWSPDTKTPPPPGYSP